MAELTAQSVSKAGVTDLATALVSADVAGDSVTSASGLIVVMQNGDASPHTLTVARPAATTDVGNLGTLAVEDITLTVAAGDFGLVAIPAGYADQGVFSWTYDAVTSVSIGVFVAAP